MTKKLLEIAAEIVQAQSSVNPMPFEQVEIALIKTFSTLQKMQKAETEGRTLDLLISGAEVSIAEKAPEKVDPKDSIQEDKVICLECAAQMKQLTAKHLSSHGLTIREYKQKWGFPLKQSLSAKSLSKARSKAAKKRGLPENLLRYREEKRLQKLEAPPIVEEESTVSLPFPVPVEEMEIKAVPKRGRRKTTAE